MANLFQFGHHLIQQGISCAVLPSGKTLNIVFEFPGDEVTGYRNKTEVFYNDRASIKINLGKNDSDSCEIFYKDLLTSEFIELKHQQININENTVCFSSPLLSSKHILRAIRDNFIDSVSAAITDEFKNSGNITKGSVITLFKEDYERCCGNCSDKDNADKVKNIIQNKLQKYNLSI